MGQEVGANEPAKYAENAILLLLYRTLSPWILVEEQRINYKSKRLKK
jgi:hypothetical protein